MAEIRTRMAAYQVERTCEVCEAGTMVATGAVQSSSPPRFDHRCTHCTCRTYFDKSYPRIEYERAE
jgi:hypothetical protein